MINAPQEAPHAHYLNRLSSGQIQFFLVLARDTPFLMPFWNVHTHCLNKSAFESFLGTACHGHAIMGRFMAGVWFHSNEFEFDYIDAAATLDRELMQVITDWLAAPYWP